MKRGAEGWLVNRANHYSGNYTIMEPIRTLTHASHASHASHAKRRKTRISQVKLGFGLLLIGQELRVVSLRDYGS